MLERLLPLAAFAVIACTATINRQHQDQSAETSEEGMESRIIREAGEKCMALLDSADRGDVHFSLIEGVRSSIIIFGKNGELCVLAVEDDRKGVTYVERSGAESFNRSASIESYRELSEVLAGIVNQVYRNLSISGDDKEMVLSQKLGLGMNKNVCRMEGIDIPCSEFEAYKKEFGTMFARVMRFLEIWKQR